MWYMSNSIVILRMPRIFWKETWDVTPLGEHLVFRSQPWQMTCDNFELGANG